MDGHLGLGRGLAQEPGDLVNDAQLVVDDFIRELGETVKTNYKAVYTKIPNRTVRWLFRTKCFGYRPISWAVRKAYGVKQG